MLLCCGTLNLMDYTGFIVYRYMCVCFEKLKEKEICLFNKKHINTEVCIDV